MNNTLLLQQFDLLATAPGGVAKLRELILTLAVQGKLVPQDPADEPASELLKRIRAEKDRLIAEGKIKRDKPLAAIGEGEQPFALPTGWEWVRALELCVLITDGDHQPPPKADSGIPFLVIGDVRTGVVDFQGASRFVPEAYFEKLDWGKQPCIGDILYTTVGSFGIPVPVIDERAFCFQRHIALLRPAFVELQSYLAIALDTPWVFGQAEKGATGIAQKTVPLSVLRDLLLPLPPLPEQARIVARVEELMRVCDALETTGQRQAAHHRQLVQTLLGDLTADSHTSWQRVAAHFDTLLDRPSAVDALEQTILQLAVRGQLVPQVPTDEPASELLKRIRAEKDRLIAAGKIKRDKPLAAIGEDEQPFALPMGWEWVSVDALAHVGTGTTPSRDNEAYFSTTGIPWITSGETGQSVITQAEQFVTARALSETSLTLYPVGTLILAMYGQGKTRGQVAELGIEATTNQACSAIVLVEQSASHRHFIKLVFEKSYDEIRSLSAGGAQPNLNVGKVKQTLIPLPPLPEQARIVTRVDQLRRLCADLRLRLTQSQTTQAQLGEALVAAAAV